MASTQQGTFLVFQTHSDAQKLLNCLESAKTITHRIVQRMTAIGPGVLAGYDWPVGYTGTEFQALYDELGQLNGFLIADSLRDKLFDLVSAVA